MSTQKLHPIIQQASGKGKPKCAFAVTTAGKPAHYFPRLPDWLSPLSGRLHLVRPCQKGPGSTWLPSRTLQTVVGLAGTAAPDRAPAQPRRKKTDAHSRAFTRKSFQQTMTGTTFHVGRHTDALSYHAHMPTDAATTCHICSLTPNLLLEALCMHTIQG